jgi:diguanylate cyclase (GGDEF)-like protein/PAS domain S-box-containing protein
VKIGPLNTQSLLIRLLAGLCILSCSLLGFELWKSQADTNHIIEENEQETIQMGASIVPRRFYVSQQILDASISQIVLDTELISYFGSRDRDALAAKAMKAFESLQRSDIDIYHFHLPNNQTFFRAHRPERFGDDLTAVRPMVVLANESQTPITGWEEGRHGFALRHIEPVFDQSEYIGAIELGMFLEERMLKIWQRAVSGEWFLCQFDDQTQSRIAGTVDGGCDFALTADQAALVKDNQNLVFRDTHSLIQILPLMDFQGEVNYYVKRIIDGSDIGKLAVEQRNASVLYGLLVLGVASLIFGLLIRRVLSPLSYLVQRAQKITEGRLDETIEVTTSDEIGLLATTMEEMRKSLASKTRQLEDSHELFKMLSDTASEWILWHDPKGRVIYTSPSSKHFTGYDAPEIKANSDLVRASIHPDDLTKWDSQMAESRRLRDPQRSEYRVISRLDGHKWIEHTSSPVFDHSGRLLGIRSSIIDITPRKHSEKKLKDLSYLDALTGLRNRTYLQAALKSFQHNGAYPVTFIAADIDGLKAVNDTWGHEVGDKLLKHAADILRSGMRRQDTLVRLGGDEFIALLPETDLESGERIVQRIREAAEDFNRDSQSVHVEISMGVACNNDCQQTLAETIQAADLLMYADKSRRKSRQKPPTLSS